MNKREFDENINKILSDFEDDLDPQSWDSFERKLSFEEEMDSLIKESVDNYKEPFNEDHWELFAQEVEKRRIRSVVKRSAEVIIILLLLFTTQNFIQYSTGTSNAARDKVFIAKLDQNIPFLYNTIDDIAVEKSFRILSSTASEETPLDNIISELIAYRQDDIYSNQLGSMKRLSLKYAYSNNTLNIDLPPLVYSPREENSVTDISNVDIKPLVVDNSSLSSEAADQILPFKGDVNRGLWISVVSGAEVNFINSPFDLNLVKSPLQSQSGSLSYGLALSQDIGRFELQTGLIYSEKQYSPARIRKFIPSLNQRYLETSLKRLQFDQVQVPLMVHFHSPRLLGVSIYGSMGAGVSIITNSFYDIKTQVRSFNGTSSIDNGVEQLNLRDLTRGVLDGGAFSDNVYVTGIIGFGLEKRFASRFAISVSANYQHSLSREINPIINRTQQIGIGVGFKTNLK